MGEPASASPANHAATLALARGIVEAERLDDDWPQPFGMLAGDPCAHVRPLIHRLAQDLADTRAALDKACDALDLEGLEDTAVRLRALDLEVR